MLYMRNRIKSPFYAIARSPDYSLYFLNRISGRRGNLIANTQNLWDCPPKRLADFQLLPETSSGIAKIFGLLIQLLFYDEEGLFKLDPVDFHGFPFGKNGDEIVNSGRDFS